jgi:5-hydroxyisourate hydrolase-like protein (transthyretin family)
VRETVETDSDGVFKVSVLPGTDAKLSASWKEYYAKTEPTVHVEEEGPAEPVTIELVRGGIVSGTVVDDETGAPVPGVHVAGHRVVAIVVRSIVGTESDEEGCFTLAGLAEGKNKIYTKNGPAFPSPNLADSYRLGVSVVVEVVVGEHQSGIELRLAKKPAIAGKVVDEKGEPIFGALLVVKGETDESGRPARQGFSEGDGTFVMRMRLYGSTIMGLLVSHPLYANTELSFEPDGVTNGTKDIVVVLKKDGASIEGTVRDENGEPQAEVAVHLLDTRKSWSRVKLKATVTDEEGHYVLAAVADGTYWVKASLGEQEVVSGAVPIVGGKKVTGVNLALPALGHIAGRVTDDQDQPLAGFLVGINWWFRGDGGARDAVTDSDGRYRFDDLLEGEKYRVSVHEKPGFDRVGSQEVACSADDIDFTIKAIGFGTVSGFVYQESDGSPVTEFYLRVSGKGNRASSEGSFNSEDGSFSFANVAAGLSVIVVSIDNVRKHATKHTIKNTTRHTTKPFEVVAGEEVVQVIYLPETGTVSGSVVRASDGSPVTRFRLSLIRADSRNWRQESRRRGG